MPGKVKVQPVSSSGLASLVEMAEQLRTRVPDWEDAAISSARPHVQSDLALDLAHLSRHDSDGFLIASIGDEVIGFAASHVRSRQLLLPHFWLLPEHLDQPIAETLVRRALAFGERSGAQEYCALLLGHPALAALLYRFGFRPRFPVFRLRLPTEAALRLGRELAMTLPGRDISADALKSHTGMADIDRLDRLVRGVSRMMDHDYWLNERRLRIATVRARTRISGYACGGPGQCGPVVASTGEAALAALGWALQLAASGGDGTIELLVPATFEAGVEHVLEAGATCVSVAQWMSRSPGAGLERYVLPGPTLL